MRARVNIHEASHRARARDAPAAVVDDMFDRRRIMRSSIISNRARKLCPTMDRGRGARKSARKSRGSIRIFPFYRRRFRTMGAAVVVDCLDFHRRL